MVGHVVSVQLQTTNHVYMIEDGLGRVEARHWVGSSGNTEQEMEKWGDIK
jgi:replication factor A2